jgi:aspartate kinase
VGLIVQKYGGTSVADPDRMRNVARHIAATREQGHSVVAVVSAMGKATDNLVELARQVSNNPHGREMDMLLTTGERISSALLCMALLDMGCDAMSFTGSQVGIITDTTHTKAKILEIKGDRVREAVGLGKVAVVAGFQGVSTALDADVCEIYTDVTGVFSADPRVVPQARKLKTLSFDEMLEMAGAGSKVLALRSVEFARNHNVPIHVRSSFTWEEGTWVVDEHDERNVRAMEEPIISGVVHDVGEAKMTLLGVPDRPGVSALLFESLAQANVNVDMIVQNTSIDGTTDISFTLPAGDIQTAEPILRKVSSEVGAKGINQDANIVKLSLVGAGMKSSPGIAAKMFRVLADNDVNIEMISTSTIRISVVVEKSKLNTAVKALHTAFDLDSGADYSAPLPERK